ncbi:hypothetical protein [Granulicella paludicola]|nr:hypothetical protein [Granulicella paludicola]
MRYTRPQITGSFPAVSTIKLTKGLPPVETQDPTEISSNAAYQADE